MCFALAIQGVIAGLLALVFRGPAGLRLLGLTITRPNGAAPTPLHALWRAAVCWSPVIAATIAGLAVDRLVPHSDVLQGFIAAIGLGVFLAGVAWTIVVPDLGPQDRLARTVVVPS